MPTQLRPAMYRLVITILLSGAVIFLGLIAGVEFFVLLLQPHSGLFSLVPLLVATIFLYLGIRAMTVAVRFLRGKPVPQEDAERWIFSVWITRM
jgi:hypothetical protein